MASVPENDMSQICVVGFSARELPGQYLDVVPTGRYLLLPSPCAQLYLNKDGPSFLTPRCRAPRRKARGYRPSSRPSTRSIRGASGS
jgi:hypothetical protein